MSISACSSETKKNVDTLVYGDYLLPMDNQQTVIEQGAVAIKNGKVVAIGTQADINKQFTAPQTVNGQGKIVMPGLINGHTHTAMTLFRGMADDLALMEWLNSTMFPMEGQFVSKEFVQVGTELACYEMIKTGTTAFVDMYFYPEIISEVVDNCGLRAVVGAPMIDFPSPGFKGWDDSFSAGVKFVKSWQGKNSRITPALAPHAPYTVNTEHLTQVGQAARELKAPITVHVAETVTEEATLQERVGKSPTQQILDTLGRDNSIIAAHMVHPSQDDINSLGDTSLSAIHNPTSNLKLGSGIAPIPQMLDAKVTVGLGTDGAASNNDLNLWEEIRLTALLHKGAQQNPEVIPAYNALLMATKMGAQAASLPNTGELAAGKDADLIQLDYQDLRFQPIYNIISHLVYTFDASAVVTSMVNGKLLMEDKKVLTINEALLKEKIAKWQNTLAKALKE